MLDATPLLRAYAARRLAKLAALDPVAAQERTLVDLVAKAHATRFGRDHGFSDIRSVADYQKRIKPRRWEDFWREYWAEPFPHLTDVTWPGAIAAFANTSGTTGAATKRIPVSRAMMRANRRAALDVLVFHLANRPRSRVLSGRNFILGGSTALETLAPGIVAGDLSGLAAADIPIWARPRTFPPESLALIDDWERKVAAIAPLSLTAEITSFSGTPSWMLLFLDHLAKLRPAARLAELYPKLELLVHGGIGFAPYRPHVARWLAGSGAETREVYPASEGFFAVADRGDDEGLRLILDNGLFFEFIRPEHLDSDNPDRRWIADAEIGAEYALLVSSNAGLWSYVVGDTVILTDRGTPRVKVSGRTAWSLSVAGEHLIGQELDAGMAEAARALGGTVIEYAAAAIHPDPDDPRGGHLFIVEADGIADSARFAAALDTALAAMNADYATHRQGDYGMRKPRVVLAPSGAFAAWMRARGKLGGQNKVPRVISDPALLADLRRFAGDADA
jgi:hypothetical protein